MKPNDETIFNGMDAENEENPQVVNESKKKDAWKLVGLGGVTGILMGAGSIYAANAVAAEDNEITSEGESAEVANSGSDTEVKVSKVIPGKSFSQAFAEARAEVGPGGVFHWHGGIYNTYTKEEWDAMSAEEKHEFAQNVRPEYSVDKVDAANISEEHPQVHVVDNSDQDVADVQTDNVNEEEVNIQANEASDDDVHIVGYRGSYDANIAGKEATVHFGQVDGHEAYVVDFNDDDSHDIGIIDKNDNAELDDGEAIDLTTGDVLDADLNPTQASLDSSDMGTDPSMGV